VTVLHQTNTKKKKNIFGENKNVSTSKENSKKIEKNKEIMSKEKDQDIFERPPTPEAPHGNVMDKAGLKPEKVRVTTSSKKNKNGTYIYIINHLIGIQEYGIHE